MTILFPTLAVAFAAFCVWLTVRIVNRRERWAKWTAVALVVVLPIGQSVTASPPRLEPALDGPEGRRAFDELAVHYARGKAPDYQQALRNLSSPDAVRRASEGRYLLALFMQSQADESNGRAEWERSIAWGGGGESAASRFREKLTNSFAAGASSEEALDAALWLIRQDELPENQKFGARVLFRIQSPRSEALFKELLAQPHPCAAVTVAVIEEVGKRRFEGLRPDLVRLATHYRSAVRDAARKTAMVLGDPQLPEYKPADAFTPWLEARLDEMAAMVLTPIPKDSRWVRIEPAANTGNRRAFDEPVPISGWLLAEDQTSFRVLTWFNSEETFEKKHLERSQLGDSVKFLAKLRQSDERAASHGLSRGGFATGQFQPSYVSLPEALVAVWSYTRGDRQSAAEVLFPCIEGAQDDRQIVRVVRDLIGNGDHLAMLDAFSHERDYDRTLALARHLSNPLFDGYFYQPRARELAGQLGKRRDDFRTFKLPNRDEWKGLQARLSREEQIRYLATRLRLLNCFQWMQPGGVSYQGGQSSKPGQAHAFDETEDAVINPYNELQELRLEIAELPTLIPFLTDENFMPTVSYWRDFHPGRTLHRVNWAVAEIVDEIAHRDLAQLKQFQKLDSQDREAHLQKLIAWCRENAGKTRAQLVLQTLADSREWPEFERAAGEAVRMKLTAAHPVLARRMADFPSLTGSIAEICYALSAPEAAADARTWIRPAEKETRFWAALILLKHGEKDRSDGLDVLTRILEEEVEEDTHFYSRAIEPLLAVGTEPAMKLAVAILPRLKFEYGISPTGGILQRLFLAGRQECLDFLIETLGSEESHGTSSGEWNGMDVKREQVLGDRAADTVMDWRSDAKRYEDLAPDEMRRAEREQLKAWLKEQFALVRAGKPTQLKAPEPLHFSRWHVDAP